MVRYRNNAFDRALCGLVVAFILLGLAAMIAFAVYSLMVIALRENAQLTVVTLASLAVGLLLTARLSGSGPKPLPASEGDDSGGDDGGQRRRPPRVPDEPPPGGDPVPDWDEFDAARREWERVPALAG